MRPTQAILKSARSAWKGEYKALPTWPMSNSSVLGPYFLPFPNLRESLANREPIYTQARDCTILPNFVGSVHTSFSVYICLTAVLQGDVYGAQWKAISTSGCDSGHGRPQAWRVFIYKEEIYIQVRILHISAAFH